jgi:hypothetical protein
MELDPAIHIVAHLDLSLKPGVINDLFGRASSPSKINLISASTVKPYFLWRRNRLK